MNWPALAAIASLAGLLATVIGVAYTHGKLTQKVINNEGRAEDNERRLDEHSGRLGDHDVAIGRLKEWRRLQRTRNAREKTA